MEPSTTMSANIPLSSPTPTPERINHVEKSPPAPSDSAVASVPETKPQNSEPAAEESTPVPADALADVQEPSQNSTPNGVVESSSGAELLNSTESVAQVSSSSNPPTVLEPTPPTSPHPSAGSRTNELLRNASKPPEKKYVDAGTMTDDAPKKTQFMDLGPELKAMIISHVIRPTDLKNLCLTCKQMHEITVRQLYREVTLEVGSPTDTKLLSFINPRNIGVKHIRKMDLYLAEVTDKCNQLQQAHFAIRMLLEFLPADTLEKFSWHPWNPFSAENLMLLYKKQKKMKWLEAIALDKDILEELEKWEGFDTIFQNTKKLGLYPDSREVLNMCAALLKRTPKVEKITLHASFDEDHDRAAIPSRELNDSSTEPGLITSTIFGHMQPFEKCVPLALRDFTLQKINLRYAADTYCKVVDFRTIKSLRVFGCSGADSLFAELSKSQKLPERLETLEFKHDDNQENDALNALDGFLCLVSGIKVLTMDVCYAKALPAVAGITRHSKTLRELNVHASRGDGEEEEMVYEFDDFEKICKCCGSIEQLSCAFPTTSVIRSNSDTFLAFEVALGDLPNLITLNITTWPNNTPSTSRLPRKIYEHLLQGMAQAGFERSVAHAAAQKRTSRLAVIAFGSSDKVYDREDSKNQIIFVKGTQADSFGKQAPLAVQVGWCLRKYVEPRSEVLDFSLARSCKPPTREPPQSDESD